MRGSNIDMVMADIKFENRLRKLAALKEEEAKRKLKKAKEVVRK